MNTDIRRYAEQDHRNRSQTSICFNFTPENFGAAVGLPLFVSIRVHSRLSFVSIRGPGLAQSMLRFWPTE